MMYKNRTDYSDPKIQRQFRQIKFSPEPDSLKKPGIVFANTNYVEMLVNITFAEKPNCKLAYLSNPKADFLKAALECPEHKDFFEKLDFIQKEIDSFQDLRWLSCCLVQKNNKHFLQMLFKCQHSNQKKYAEFFEKHLGSVPKIISSQLV